MHPSRTLALLIPFLTSIAEAAPKLTFQTSDQLTGRADVGFNSLSNDGKVISGTFLDGGKASVYRYSARDGFQVLASDLPANTEGVYQMGMSDEGKLVYGYLQYDADQTYQEGFVWTAKDGFQRLGQIGGGNYTVTSAVTLNNKVVGGQYGIDGQYGSFTWTQRDGIRSFASLFPDFPAAALSPNWISNNQQVVWASGYDNGSTVMRWVRGKGTTTFGDLAGGYNSITLNTVTANGRLGFGAGSSENGFEAVCFREDGTIFRILPGAHFQSIATDTILGGRVVVGGIDPNLSQSRFQGSDSFFLDRMTGKFTLLSDLISTELPELRGWTSVGVGGISSSGNIAIGGGVDGEGKSRSFKITGLWKFIMGKP